VKNKKTVVTISAFVIVAAVGGSLVFANNNQPLANEKLPALTSKSTLTEVEYKETVDPNTYGQTKKGYVYETHGTGATKWVDTEVIAHVGDRQESTQAILVHSYKIIDAFILGIAETQGLGDFQLTFDELEVFLREDHKKFSELYEDEIKRGKEVTKDVKEGETIPWGGISLDQALVRIALEIDKAYLGAIDNLTWSNLESSNEAPPLNIDEEWEHTNMRQIDADTRLMKARDTLQRYSSWLFDGKLSVDGVKPEDRPIPERDVNVVK